jgi:hypothetical protein
LELGLAPWQSLSIDLIIELPLSKEYSQIWVIVNHFTKIAHIILLKDDAKIVPNLGPIFTKEIQMYYSLLTDFISDSNTHFSFEL